MNLSKPTGIPGHLRGSPTPGHLSEHAGIQFTRSLYVATCWFKPYFFPVDKCFMLSLLKSLLTLPLPSLWCFCWSRSTAQLYVVVTFLFNMSNSLLCPVLGNELMWGSCCGGVDIEWDLQGPVRCLLDMSYSKIILAAERLGHGGADKSAKWMWCAISRLMQPSFLFWVHGFSANSRGVLPRMESEK